MTTTPAAGPPPMPGWVKVLAALFVLFVVLFALAHLTGRGLHGH